MQKYPKLVGAQLINGINNSKKIANIADLLRMEATLAWVYCDESTRAELL